MVINYRLYTALYYLKKGILKAFFELLCIKEPNEKNIVSNDDFKFLENQGYIIYKNPKVIILTKKAENLLNKKGKNKSEKEIDDEYIKEFLKGFPSNRYGDFPTLLRELQSYYIKNKYSKEHILQAKEQYIKDMAAKNFAFIKNASNFVIKDLDNYCRYMAINQEENKTINTTTNGLFMD